MKKLLLLAAFCSASNSSAQMMSPTLINGKPVQPGEFPEVVYITMKNSRCSATIVGPKVVLTAAHCAREGGKMSFQVGQTLYSGVCHAPDAYPSDDHDISLCLVDKNIPGPYASVAQKGPEVGDKVTLIGYGCTKPKGGGGNDGILRVGISTVTGFTDWDFITKKDAALCYGDSGGPAFRKIANPKGEHHYVMGVNSKGDIKSISWLSQLYSLASQGFMESWSKKNDAKICGVTAQCDIPPAPKVCEESWQQFEATHAPYDAALVDLERCMFKRTVSTCGEEVDAVRLGNVKMSEAFLKLTGCLSSVE